jgi:ABC-type thiamin/hydroxymethylpyrimidine transport system permease subunit
MITTTDIRAKAKQKGASVVAEAAAYSETSAIAVAEGLIDGIVEGLVQRIGVERTFQIVQQQADILDRVILDANRPRKPRNQCGQD